MSDVPSRPRPEYGEYATPEEQRAAIKSPELNPHYAPPERSQVPQTERRPDAPVDARQPPTGDGTRSEPPYLRHRTDRVVTIALLVLGLYNVIGLVMGRAGIGDQITSAYRSMGITGDYATTALTGTVADVIAFVSLALWIAAAGLSGWMMVRGRLAFWIPLTAGVAAGMVGAVGYLILFLHDPAFIAYVQKAG